MLSDKKTDRLLGVRCPATSRTGAVRGLHLGTRIGDCRVSGHTVDTTVNSGLSMRLRDGSQFHRRWQSPPVDQVHIINSAAGELIGEACVAIEYGASRPGVALAGHSRPISANRCRRKCGIGLRRAQALRPRTSHACAMLTPRSRRRLRAQVRLLIESGPRAVVELWSDSRSPNAAQMTAFGKAVNF